MCDRSRRTPRVSVSRPITALIRCVAVVLHPELRHSVQRVTQVCIRLYAVVVVVVVVTFFNKTLTTAKQQFGN